jgi:ribose transport system permease protein
VTDPTRSEVATAGVGGSDAPSVPRATLGAPEAAAPDGLCAPSWRSRIRRSASFQNVSAVYIFIALFAVFSLWVPSTFLTASTWRTLISQQSITCLASIGLVVPIAAGVIDLAIGSEIGVGAILVAWLLADQHASIPVAVALTLASGVIIGLAIWFLVVRVRINSFIATLGMSSVLLAAIEWLSGEQQILNLPASFANIATNELFGLTYPVYITLAVAVIVWYVLERTPAGRRVYATGGNIEAARLTGIRTSRVILAATITCGVIAAAAGLLQSSEIATGDPTIGPPYLLPTITAVFLGSTQFRGGRANVWGTVLGTYVIATGVKGLQLAGAPLWIPDLFDGIALLLAVGIASYQRSPTARTAAIRRALGALRRPESEP